MKNAILASALFSMISTAAFAGELCGTLGSHVVAPHCEPGAACPMWLRLQYDIQTADGATVGIETASLAVLHEFGELKGSEVCALGTDKGEAFEVTSIEAK